MRRSNAQHSFAVSQRMKLREIATPAKCTRARNDGPPDFGKALSQYQRLLDIAVRLCYTRANLTALNASSMVSIFSRSLLSLILRTLLGILAKKPTRVWESTSLYMR